MKKIISFILVAILCLGVLTSCDVINGLLGNNQPAGPTVEEAANFLHDIYKDKKATTSADFDVVGQVSLNGVIFPVEWTSDNESVSIRPSTKTGFYTVDIPDQNSAEFNYTLTAKISDADGNSATKSYTFTVPVINNSGITSTPVEGVAYKIFLKQGNLNDMRYYALNTTQDGANKFINTTLEPKEGADFYVEIVDGGYKFYTMIGDVKTYVYAKIETTINEETGAKKYSKYIGFNAEEGSVFSYSEAKGGVWTVTAENLVWGVGTYNSFTTISISEESYFTPDKVGSSQFVIQLITSDVANGYEADKLPEAPSEAKDILDKLYALADGESAAGEFKLTGKITELDSYNNPTIVVEGYEDMPVYCYRLSDDRFVVGATITVTALQMKNYGGTYEFMSCTLDDLKLPGNQGGNTSDLGIVDSPEVGVAYKFGLFHGNEGATVFFNGQNYNNYAWYLAYDATGVDVYLEAVDGIDDGFRIYFMNGETKTYIRVYQDSRDGHEKDGTMELTTSTPAEYFTFDYDYNTLIWTNVDGFETYLGSSGTYKSISCSNISYITKDTSYVAHLYAAGATGEEGGNQGGNEGGNEGGETVSGVVDPVVGTAYKFGMVQGNLNKTFYLAGGMNGFYLATTENAAEAIDVYLEETEGGYYLYVLDGESKLYINMVVATGTDGKTHVNGAYEATASTVYTYDDDNQTVVSSLVVGDKEAENYWLGTRNDKNYNTVGPCAVAYEGFYCQFYAIGESDDNGGNEGGNEGGETTTPDGVMTIPEVLKAAEGTAVIVKGTVVEFYENWNTQFNNNSFYIADEDGNKVLVFRTGTKVALGDEVTVNGTATLYNEKVQIAQGSTVTIDVVHVCSEYTDADCLNAAECVVCGAVNGTALGHSYVNDACERCGATKVTGTTVTASKTMAELITALGWGTSTTKQSFTLDDNVSVKIDGGNNTGKAYNGDHIRIYATDTPAGTITISVADGYELVSIKVTTQTGTYAFLCVDGSDADISNSTVSVSGSSVVLNSVKNGSDGKQVRVMAIEVVYQAK